jgi:dolichyl-phosphate beta-glucosyltransferase
MNLDGFEIILIDDGSFDNTLEILNKFKFMYRSVRVISYEDNKGKGYAVRQGVLESQYPWVLFMDADNATSISELKKFYPYMEEYDLIVGSRNLKDSKLVVPQSIFRRILGKVFSYMVRIAISTKVKDTQCGFKLFNEKIKALFQYQTCDRFAFDVELIKNTELNKYKIKEVGINWYNDNKSKVHPILDVYDMFRDVVKIWRIKRN